MPKFNWKQKKTIAMYLNKRQAIESGQPANTSGIEILMESGLTYTHGILLLPLIAFVVIGLLSKKLPNVVASGIAVTAILGAAVLSYMLAKGYFLDFGNVDGTFVATKAFEYTWLRFTDTLQINIGMLVDPISTMMLIVVTTISRQRASCSTA